MGGCCSTAGERTLPKVQENPTLVAKLPEHVEHHHVEKPKHEEHHEHHEEHHEHHEEHHEHHEEHHEHHEEHHEEVQQQAPEKEVHHHPHTEGVSLDEILLYDDILVIAHTSNKHSLHSHGLKYETGSKKQQVTAFEGRDDNDNWTIKGKHDSSKKHKHTGEVKYYDVIRLKHKLSKKYLSIHAGHGAPVSTDCQEVCAAEKKHDEVNWVIEPVEDYGTDSWNPQHEIRLRNEATGLYLHISQYNFELGNGDSQGEIYAAPKDDSADKWYVESKTTIQHSSH